MRRSRVWMWTLLLALCAGGAGCSSIAELCEERADCEGMSDQELDDCIVSDEAAADLADSYDCGEEFDASFDCWADNATCSDGVYSVPEGACDSEGAAYQECMSKAGGW